MNTDGDRGDKNAQQSEAKAQPKPEPEKDEADGREVFVTKDESGITSLSEAKEGADPSVTTDASDGEGDSDNGGDDSGDDSGDDEASAN